jgi:diguanylate cyclase (GGDEF)-like protein/PAS domain S-box-containing protein
MRPLYQNVEQDGIELDRRLRLAYLALESARDGIIVHRPDGELVLFNRAAAAHNGFTFEEFGRLGPWGWADAVDPAVRQARLGQIREKGELVFTVRRPQPDGTDTYLEVASRWVETEEGPIVVAATRDVTTRVMAERMLEHMAMHDPLTSLANRVLLDDRLERAVSEARRHGDALCVALIDVDDFKRVNDACGHDVGDQVLVSLARRLEGAVRSSDTIARLGGDEFVVVLPRLESPRVAREVAQKLTEAVARPIPGPDCEIDLTASVGVAVFDPVVDDPRSLLVKADVAMYRAKRAGGRRVHLLQPHDGLDV